MEITGLYFWIFVCKVALLVGIALAGLWFVRDKRKSQEYIQALEKVSDYIGNGLIFFDKKDRLVDANDCAREYLPDLFKGQSTSKKTLKDFVNYCFDHAADVDQSLLNMLGRAGGKADAGGGFREVIAISEDRMCLVEAQKTPAGGTNLVLIDISDIKNQEDQMLRLNRFSHELYQAVQVATSGVIITKPEDDGKTHRTVFANDAFFKIMELVDCTIIGKDVTEIFSRIDDAKAVNRIRQIALSQETGTVEMRIDDPKEGVRWYDLKLTPVKDAAGHMDLFIGILSDVTEVKIREAELSKTQKLEALGQLSAGVAHDFNNVLSIIDGYARLTATGLKGDEKAEANLERIRVAAQRGTDLIRKMLTFARHEIVDNTVLDFSEAVNDQETLLMPLLDASVNFKLLTDKQEMFVECPQDNLTQILMNLVVNARDAMPYGGTLLIEARMCQQAMLPDVLRDADSKVQYACLLVSDTGTGMDDETVNRIFDPFFTTKDQGKGTGLGLSMVYGLVKQIGGHIDVKSSLGMGTTITIYLPLTDKTPKKITGDENDVSAIRFDGYTAIVAEDEPDLLLLVTGMLEELGMKVLQAKDGHEALAVQDEYEGKVDLLLTDVVMPELNGVDLADLMEDLQPDAKVVFMSGYPAKGHEARVQIPEHAMFIPKPIKRDDLVQAVYNTLVDDAQGHANMPRWSSKESASENEGVAS